MGRIVSVDGGWGIAAVRVVLGVIFVSAGWQKFANGMEATSASFAKMGIPAPGVAAPFIAGLELVGGALLLVGFLTRWLGLLYTVQFLVITFYVKSFAQGLAALRLDLLILAGSLLLLLAGPGRAALDALWLERPTRAKSLLSAVRRRAA